MEVLKNHGIESATAKWQIRRFGQVLCFGPAETMPTREEIEEKEMCGCEIYIDGKPWEEAPEFSGKKGKK